MRIHPFASKFSSAKRHLDKPRNRRLLLFIALILPIFILLILTSAPKHYQSIRRLRQRAPLPVPRTKCKYGTVFVYDIPPIFNKKLVENCRELDPWNSRCGAFINGGFGPRATNLDGIVPPELSSDWYWTDIFAGEVIYHSRILNYECRTHDPESATAFYIPFYAGLAIAKYLYNHTAVERDAQCESMLRWVTQQLAWRRSNGGDHFLMLGRTSWDFRREADGDWGSRFLLMPEMRHVWRLAIEGNVWDQLDIGVPYPTGFHPRKNTDIEKWQRFVRTRSRSSLFTFVGGKREKIKGDFRVLLLNYCGKESDSCKLVDCSKASCSDGTPAILEAFLDSAFCLQPRGDSYTRKSTFDCILAGSIPVFFWKKSINGHYDEFLRDDPARFSVFIDEKKVRNGTSIRNILEGYGVEEIQMMRERVTNLIPRLLYALPGEENIRDAFEIAIEGVLRRISEQKVNQN